MDKITPNYLSETICFGGEFMARGTAIAIMQKEGHGPSAIDRWMQGNDLRIRLQEAARG